MSDSDQIAWDEVESAAKKMFDVWVHGAELKWAKEAWRHLRKAGLTTGATILEITATKLRLVTLARIYEEFCGIAWDENRETPLTYLAEDLEIDPIALGILAAKADPDTFEELTENDSIEEAALTAVTDAQRDEIFQCLRNAYGNEIRLYTRIWHTRRPMTEETEGNEFEVTAANAMALEYVQNGFRR